MFRQLFIICSILLPVFLAAQETHGLVAKYYFNQGNTESEFQPEPVKAVGVSFRSDRFGNPSSACYLNGSSNSYLNLGTSAALKPAAGTISIWIRITGEIFAGHGAAWNPVIITKNGPGNDFFEAYCIAYSLVNKRISIANTSSSLNQLTAFSIETMSLEEWHHVVMTYDDSWMCLYVDGVLQDRVIKNFRSVFLATDSVMVGNSANVKNNRFFAGAIDDLRIYSRVLTQEEITALYEEPNPNRLHNILKMAGWILLCVAGLCVIVMLIVAKFKRELRREKEKSRLQSQFYAMEMKVIKAQMNPHFIFNSMNSIQQFILASDIENANTYLVKFSRLLRKILESNTDENISVDNEIDILNKYIELEALRFDHAFTYEIISDSRLSGSATRIPQMMIQPFVENAIWHGLLLKEGNKKLKVTFEQVNEKLLSCTIDDDGVGRRAPAPGESVTKSKSLGIHFITQRLELMKKEWGGDYSVKLIDKRNTDGSSNGTRVIITIPILS
jgi:two-component sensor histidine kinase